MIIFVWPSIITTKRGFNGVYCLTLELIKQCHSSCRFLGFLIAKPRVLINEEWANLRHDEGKQSCLLGFVGHIAAVHEDVLASAVAMEVAEDLEISFLGKLVDHLLTSVDCWMKHLAGSFPSSVEIAACK